MLNISELNHKLIEVSHDEIAIQLLKLWNLEVQFWGPILNTIANSKKSNMKMGQKLVLRLTVII